MWPCFEKSLPLVTHFKFLDAEFAPISYKCLHAAMVIDVH